MEAKAAVEKIGELLMAGTQELADTLDLECKQFSDQIITGSAEYLAARRAEFGMTEPEYERLRTHIDDLTAQGTPEDLIVHSLIQKRLHHGSVPRVPADASLTAIVTKVRDVALEWLH